MKKFILVAAFLLALTTQASALVCTLPFTLINGTLADANQVMANENSLAACFLATGSGTVNPGTTGQIGIYPAPGSNVIGGATMSGDCTITVTGLITCTKTNGVSFLPNGLTNSYLAQMPADTVKCNNTGSTATPIDCTTVITKVYQSLQTVSWFATDTPAVNFISSGDRVFIGDAINYPNNNTCGTGDWFTNFENTTSNGPCAYIGSFQMVVESKINNSNAGAGILTAGQSAHISSATNGSFGLASFGMENKTGAGSRTGGSTWAIYGECDKTVDNGGNCYGLELDVMTAVNTTNNPDPFTQGSLVGNQIGCGSGLTTPTNFNCSSAIQIVKNVQPFRAGIVFINGSLATGAAGGINAVAMPLTYSLAWYSSAGTAQGSITVDNTNNLNLNTGGTIKVNGNAGVSCGPGSPTASFQTLDGIVIHC